MMGSPRFLPPQLSMSKTRALIAGLFCATIVYLSRQPRKFAFTWQNSSKHHSLYTELDIQWDKLSSSHTLQWRDCYLTYQCARFNVPLNHSQPDTSGIASIAIIRKPSSLSHTDPDYRGPVLVNPGGPGMSGVDFVLSRGDLLGSILGPQFDILGFDPRGVGRSTPSVSFFKSEAERASWPNLRDEVVTNSSLPTFWARAKLQGRLAKERDSGHLKYMNTEQTARDMLSIVDAHGRHKLQYWGFSYGSVLGVVFASIFPDRIERLVVDGVVDIENYFDTLWSTNLLDTDKAMQMFFKTCTEAGPSACPFYAPTPDAIAHNLSFLYDLIHIQPKAVQTNISYGILDYRMLRRTIFHSLFDPYALFKPLSQGLADLAAGDGTSLYRIFEQTLFECSCDDSSDKMVSRLGEAAIAIHCNDGMAVSDSLDEAQSFLHDFMGRSEWAEVWAGAHLSCIGWPKFPENHFKGPFGANSTSHPILFVGNTADPATPLKHAHKMSRKFAGSTVLTVDSPGHGSLKSPSSCTHKYLREYFVDGTLPKPGTVCAVDRSPFSEPYLTTLKANGLQAPLVVRK